MHQLDDAKIQSRPLKKYHLVYFFVFAVTQWNLLSKYQAHYLFFIIYIIYMCASVQGEWDKQPLPVVTSILDKPHYPCEGGAPPTSRPLTPPVWARRGHASRFGGGGGTRATRATRAPNLVKIKEAPVILSPGTDDVLYSGYVHI